MLNKCAIIVIMIAIFPSLVLMVLAVVQSPYHQQYIKTEQS